MRPRSGCTVRSAWRLSLAAGAVARRLWDETPSHPLLCSGTFTLLYIFDQKMVDFTANGMETAFMLLSLSGRFRYWHKAILAVASPRILVGGVDVEPARRLRLYRCAVVGRLPVPSQIAGTLVISLLKNAVVCAVYLPWFAWAWWYYGSPVPHTIIAKSGVETGVLTSLVSAMENFFPRFMETANYAFLPSYGLFECTWFDNRVAIWALYTLTRSTSAFCLVYFLFPVNDRLGRAASLCFTLIICYFAVMMPRPWPWYYPPATLLGLVSLSSGIVTLSDVARHGPTGCPHIACIHCLPRCLL